MPSVFVECRIDAPIERVWELTQDPSAHERWDLRFTDIDYLPQEEGTPQRFLYRTRIGFGLAISGEGETVGDSTRADSTRTSSLRFGSDHPLSLIREGSGYWQYEPDGEATRFRTRYDYRVRFGIVGTCLDLAFRPLIGWATAWSFDALRLWAEQEIPPELSRLRGVIHGIARVSLAFIWAWHGLVPKLLFPATGEWALTEATGLPARYAPAFVTGMGMLEIAFAIALLLFWRTRSLLALQVPILLLVPLALARRGEIFTRPFTPLTLNLAMAALALCGTLADRDLPRAGRCRRRPLP